MGISRLSGPVYGSKSLLWAYFTPATSSGTSTAIASVGANRTIPPYEDWFITEMHVTCSTCSSLAARVAVKSEGGSTTIPPRLSAPGNGSTQAQTIFSITSGTSTSLSTSAIATVSAGEYEGAWVPAGSTLRIVSSASTPIANLNVQIMGYIRYVDSTRAV